MRFIGWTVISLVVLALVIGLVLLDEANTPSSTAGVSVVGDNVARVPAGEDFVLTHRANKIKEIWHITYDGDQTVHFDQEDLGPISGDHRVGTLCGVGCTTTVDMGFMRSDMEVSLRKDGAVDVAWPWGWNYQPHDS